MTSREYSDDASSRSSETAQMSLSPSAATDVSPGPARRCAWCDEPIPARARSDAKFCAKRCRQASHRFHRGAVRRVAAGHPMRLGYADPPYPGMARRYYAGHPDYAGEVDHARLVEQLVDGFPDGWALSTSAAALRDVLASCPPGVRVAAWIRGERPTRSYRPLSAWEPVVYMGGRAYLSSIEARRVDALVHHARPRLTDSRRVVGAKPAAFCWWLFELLGALPGDEVVDLFPGSGGVARAWRHLSPPGGHDPSPPGQDGGSRRGDPRDTSSWAAARSDASCGDGEDGSSEALDDASCSDRRQLQEAAE